LARRLLDTGDIHEKGPAMISIHFARARVSTSLLDQAIFASISMMSVFALFSPVLSLGA
jgi:hypothetical protein